MLGCCGRHRRRNVKACNIEPLVGVPCIFPFVLALVALQIAGRLVGLLVVLPLGHLFFLVAYPCGVRKPTSLRSPTAVGAVAEASNPLGARSDASSAPPSTPPVPLASPLPGFDTLHPVASPFHGTALYLNVKARDLLLPGDVLCGRLTGLPHNMRVDFTLVCHERYTYEQVKQRKEFYVVVTRTIVSTGTGDID